jgi:hypothetical protein
MNIFQKQRNSDKRQQNGLPQDEGNKMFMKGIKCSFISSGIEMHKMTKVSLYLSSSQKRQELN